MTADANPKALQTRLIAVAPDLELGFRPMFGGMMAYASGKPLASLSKVGLALKAVGATRDALLAIPGAAPLRYEPDGPPSKSYVLLPAAISQDDDALRRWALRTAAELPAPKPKSGKPRATPGND